jgi:signal transduction histidine kinase
MSANAAPRRHLLATMSHELRTPLNAIIGYSQSLATDSHSQAEVVEFAGAIHQAGQQLLGLVNTLLDVARIEQGLLEVQSDLIDVFHLLSSCADQAAAQAQRCHVMITVQKMPKRALLCGDEKLLRQVLNQLVANALAFTPAGGRIDLSAACDDELRLNVQDTGSGIADDLLDAAFAPFAHLDASPSRRTPGSGLGLYVSRALIEAHGGTLSLGHAEGGGVVASIALPADRLVSTPLIDQLQDMS